MELVKSFRPVKYNQSYQQQSIEFTFAKKEGKKLTQLTQPFLCRDYFNDILYAEESGIVCGEENGPYGFRFNPHETPIDRDSTRLTLKLIPESKSNLQKNLKIIWDIEDSNGLFRTKILDLEDDHLLVEGDPSWMRANFMISLYSFLLKCASYSINNLDKWEKELITRFSSREAEYMRGVSEEKFKALSKKLNEIYNPSVGVVGYSGGFHSVHDNSGWLSTFGGHHYILNIIRSQYAQRANNLWINSKPLQTSSMQKE